MRQTGADGRSEADECRSGRGEADGHGAAGRDSSFGCVSHSDNGSLCPVVKPSWGHFLDSLAGHERKPGCLTSALAP